jgi:hypothetical protein
MMNFRRLFRTREALAFGVPDILDHPDLRRMTLRELADLPFPRPGQPGETSGDNALAAASRSTPLG